MAAKQDKAAKVNFSNKVSVFRILSVPFFAGIILYYGPQRDYLRFIALAVFILAVLSDAVDGFIARVKKEKTVAGSIIDPLADKILLVTAFTLIYLRPQLAGVIKLPLWVVIVVVSRDSILLLGAVIIYMVKNQIKVEPTIWGKLATIFQMATVISILLQLGISQVIWFLAIFFTLVSCLDYIRKGFQLLYANDTKNNLRVSR